MVSLKPGVLVKLLEDMNADEKGSEDYRKPVLLQIRSIIPVLEEGDFWPNRGFYLKVSDSTHAIYASLPQQQNEMILTNKLKLGQFIYVQKLESVNPVPMLRGITIVSGRRPCEGTPQDILPATNVVKILEASDTDSIVEKGVISEKKIIDSSSDSTKLIRGSSDSEALLQKRDCLIERPRGRFRSLSASRAHPRFDEENRAFDVLVGQQKIKSSSVDNDSDTDSTLSSVSVTRVSKRRSWTESEILAVKEIFDSSVVKKEMRPMLRSRSANKKKKMMMMMLYLQLSCFLGFVTPYVQKLPFLRQVSPVRSLRYDSSDDNSSVTSRRRDATTSKRIVKSYNKSKIPISKVKREEASCVMTVWGSVQDKKGADTTITWDSLPSSLVKLGKEVMRQRDVAQLAAVEALQEACASERLLRCLSMYSEFQSAEGDDLQPFINKFLNLQDDLAHTRLIMQSLTNISPLRTSDADSSNIGTIKEVLDLALERKKNAASWIKSAVALDLSPFPSSLKATTTSVENTIKKSTIASRDTKPKGTCIVKKQRRNSEIPIPCVLAADKDDQEWSRGSTLWANADLAASLQDECRSWILGNVEKYLDEVERRASLVESDSQITGIMYNIKRVNDWLDVIVGKEANSSKDECKESSTLNDSETEACARLRSKIYGILLKHVERTAMAMDASA